MAALPAGCVPLANELHRCIDQAAHLFLGDLVRASEISEAAIARWQLSHAH